VASPAVTVRYGGSDDDSPPDIIAGETTVFVSSTDLPANTSTGYDDTKYPASPAVNYYFQAELAGQDNLRSQVFGPDDGHGEWNDLVFSADGSWDVKIYDASDDSQVATATVTVEPAA
jgi:hypothetical protein